MTAPDPRDHLAGKYEQMSALDKVEWMVEADGYALEVVAPDAEADPPQAGYAYTVNFPAHVQFPGVVFAGALLGSTLALLTAAAGGRLRRTRAR